MTDTTSLGNLLKQFSYPDTEERRDLWVIPLSPLGIDPDKSKNIRVLYFGGEPRAIFGLDIPDDQLLKFASGSAFSYPPPIIAAINSGTNHYFLFNENSYRSITDLPVWEGLLKLKAGAIST